jgi:two-component sensor histidine kinase
MLSEEIDLLSELNEISKIHFLNRDKIDEIMIQMAGQVTKALRIERINAWVFNKDHSALISVGEYDVRYKSFKRNTVLRTGDYPQYFNALAKNEIIHAPDINQHPDTASFKESYSDPNNIKSLLDIPLRINGKLIGVLCFEKTETQKTFTQSEIQFCLSVSFIVAITFEARLRRALQNKLEKAIKEKELLLDEVNHRVKNNFSIIVSLMRLSADKATSNETKEILKSYEQRIFSMLKIHDLLSTNTRYLKVNLKQYLHNLVNEFLQSYPEFKPYLKIYFDHSVTDIYFPTKKAIHLGLIVTEILLNLGKHCKIDKEFEAVFSLQLHPNNTLLLRIGDNGAGFDFYKVNPEQTMGISLIEDLIKSLDIQASYPTTNNCYYTLVLTTDNSSSN